MSVALRVGLLLVGLATSACAKTTLQLRNGAEVDAIVEGADDAYIYVQLDRPRSVEEAEARAAYAQPRWGADGEREDGRRLHRIRRVRVEGTSPPGRAAGIAGTVILTAGLGVALGGILQVQSCQGEDWCGFGHALMTIPGFVVAGAGAPLMIAGWVVYANAARAARPQEPAFTVRVFPFVQPRQDRAESGVAATLTW